MSRSLPHTRALVFLLLNISCASAHKEMLTMGLDPQPTMAQLFSLTEPSTNFFAENERMIRVTERQTYLMTGDKSLTIKWGGKNGASLLLLEGDNSVDIILGPMHQNRTECEVVRVIRKAYFTSDPSILEVLSILWRQLSTLTYYDNGLILDSPFLDIELYDKSGVIRRMTLYAPYRPDYEALMSDAISSLCSLCDAANVREYHEGCKNQYENLARRNPSFKKYYSLQLSRQLAWSPSFQKPMKDLKELSKQLVEAEERLKSGIVPSIDIGDCQTVPFDPGDAHPPSERHNYFFPIAPAGKGKQ